MSYIPTIWADGDLITAQKLNKLETGLSNIGNTVDKDTIALEFNPSNTYTAGQYVYKEGVLYRFTADHAVGAWTGSDAKAVTVGNELTSLKADLNVLFDNEVVDFSSTPKKGVYISANTGLWTSNGYSYFIPINSTTKIVTVKGNESRGSIIALLTTNNSTVGTAPSYANGCSREFVQPGDSKSITVPADAKYIAIANIISSQNFTPESVNIHSVMYATLNDLIASKSLSEWEIGSYNYPDGNNYASSSRIRLTRFVGNSQGIFTVEANEGYELSIFAWDETTGAYVGAYMTSNIIKNSGTMKWVSDFDFTLYPEYKFKVVMRNATTPTADMTVAEGENATFSASKFNGEDNIESIGGITHEKPSSIGQLNVIRRARQMTDIRWTPAFDIPRISQMAKYTGGANDSYFQDVFKAGVEYTGLPYGQATRHASAWGKDAVQGMKVGWTVGFETFISAVSNSESIVAKDSVYVDQGGNHLACFYAMICTALCGYAFALDTYYTTAQIRNAPGMTNLGTVESVGATGLALGDMILNAAHGAIITDKLRNDNGDITAIEISEATTIGNDDWNVQGSQYGGICRRRMWAVDEFLTKWGPYYNVYRYANIDSVPYTKSPYVDTGDEGEALRVVNFPVMPYMGENFEYVKGYIGNTKILTPAYREGYTNKLRVKKDGENWNANGTTDYYDVSGAYVEVGFTEVGTYEAYLCQVENGTEIIQTRAAHWVVTE